MQARHHTPAAVADGGGCQCGAVGDFLPDQLKHRFLLVDGVHRHIAGGQLITQHLQRGGVHVVQVGLIRFLRLGGFGQFGHIHQVSSSGGGGGIGLNAGAGHVALLRQHRLGQPRQGGHSGQITTLGRRQTLHVIAAGVLRGAAHLAQHGARGIAQLYAGVTVGLRGVSGGLGGVLAGSDLPVNRHNGVVHNLPHHLPQRGHQPTGRIGHLGKGRGQLHQGGVCAAPGCGVEVLRLHQRTETSQRVGHGFAHAFECGFQRFGHFGVALCLGVEGLVIRAGGLLKALQPAQQVNQGTGGVCALNRQRQQRLIHGVQHRIHAGQAGAQTLQSL